jgi:hypothetical protein
MATILALTLTLTMLGQGAAPDPFPLSLYRGMELDDLDREIRRQQEIVLMRKSQIENTLKLSTRGLVSRDEAQRQLTDVKLQEARKDELLAYRAIKAYERDVLVGEAAPDETVGYRLLLNLLVKQEGMGRVELEYREFRYRQEVALFQRKATSRYEHDLALLDYEAAKGNVEISRARQAQVAMEWAARSGLRPHDPEEFARRKEDYLKARIRYTEVRIAGLRKRLTMAEQSRQAGLIGDGEVETLRALLESALEDLDSERKLLEDLKVPLPPRATRFT